MKRLVTAVIAASIPLACAPQSRLDLDPESESRQLSAIAVKNSGIEPLKLYDRSGYVGHVGVGETRCFALRIEGPYWLMASFNAYSSVTTPVFLPETQPGWVWELATYSMKYDALRVLPADQPCRTGARARLARRSK